MAHVYSATPAPAKPGVAHNQNFDSSAIRQARVDLAACFRAAAELGLQEGICNHFSAVVPGFPELFLVNPLGLAFEEITASSLLICNHDGDVIQGDGTPEATAFFIHGRLHATLPRAKAAFHTHMPYATALAMTAGAPLTFAGQTALKFHGRVTVDDAYNGLALDHAEGDRIAASIGDADICFMRNHGVLVLGPSIAEAFDDLYYLERACAAQVLAESTGRPLHLIPPAVAARTAAAMRAGDQESARLHLESIKRRLDRRAPEYRA
jgi:ribulose-5-phosphate 4-epimerase/fuculose-1-phosphate aldolase